MHHLSKENHLSSLKCYNMLFRTSSYASVAFHYPVLTMKAPENLTVNSRKVEKELIFNGIKISFGEWCLICF